MKSLSSYFPLCIWEGAGAAAISAGGGLLGNVIGGLFNSNESKKQREWQTSERLASQEYNTSERVASQEWQDMQRVAQNKYAEDMYNKYESPEALVNQYKAAGFNPAAVMGNAAGGTMNVSSGSSGGAPSGTHVGTPTTSAPFQPIGAWADSFSDVASALKSIMDAKRAGVETSWLDKIYENQIKESVYRQEAMKLGNILSTIDIKYKDKEKQAHLQEIIVGVANGVLKGKELEKTIESLGIKNDQDRLVLKNWYRDFESILKNREASTSNLNSGTSLNYQGVKESEHRISNIDADTALKEALKITERTKPELNKSLTRANNTLSSLQDLQVRLKTVTFGKEREALEVQYDKMIKELRKDINYIETELDELKGPGKLSDVKSIDDFYDYLSRGYLELRHFNSNGPLY